MPGSRVDSSQRIVRWRWGVIGLLLLVTAGLGLGLRDLRFDFSPTAVFETGDEDNRFWRELCRVFGRDDRLVMIVVKRRSGVLESGVLEYLERLTDRIAREPWATRVRAITNVKVATSEGDALRIAARGAEITESLVGRSLQLDGMLINERRDATWVVVDLAPRFTTVKELRPLVSELEIQIRKASPPQDVVIDTYGLPSLRVEAVRMMRAEYRVLLPLVMTLFIVVLLAIFGWRPMAVIAPLSAVVVTLVWTGGLMGHAGQPVNIMTNVLPILLVAIGISDSIHLLSRYREESSRQQHLGKHVALHTAFRALAAACFVTSFTTAVGFASLAVSRTAVLVHFAWIAAAGVLFAYATTILQVPALLSFSSPLKQVSRGLASLVTRSLERLGRFVTARPRSCLVGSALVLAAVIAGASGVEINFHIRDALDPDSGLYRRQVEMERDVGGLISLVVSVRARDQLARADRPLRSAEVLRRVWALQQLIDQQPGAGRSTSPATLVRALKVALVGEHGPTKDPLQDPDLPASDEELAQLLLVASMGEQELDWGRLVTSDWRHLRIVTRFTDRGSRKHAVVFARIEKRAKQLFADQEGIEVRISGQGHLAVRALHTFIEDLLYSLLTAAVVIFLTIGLLLRSWRDALVSIVPNLFPLACAFCYMGLSGIPLNAITVVAFPVALGLAVDDSIHFLARFREERARGPTGEALVSTFRGAGRPILNTTALISLGLAVMLLGSFRATQHFAQVILVAVLCALPADLLILPALLRLVYRDRR